jgi:hypothetical protein
VAVNNEAHLMENSVNNNNELKVVNVKPGRSTGSGLDRQNTTRNNESRRRMKMNVLLTFIAVIFAASWLPLNLFNILSDSKMSIIKPGSVYYIINAVCILFGMSSAVSNPFLYGFLNENFKREYRKLFDSLASKCDCLFRRGGAQTQANQVKTPNTIRREQQQQQQRQLPDSPNQEPLLKKTPEPSPDEHRKLAGNPVIRVNSENISENNLA